MLVCGGGPSADTFLVQFTGGNWVEYQYLGGMQCRRLGHNVAYIAPFVYMIGGTDGVHTWTHCEWVHLQHT